MDLAERLSSHGGQSGAGPVGSPGETSTELQWTEGKRKGKDSYTYRLFGRVRFGMESSESDSVCWSSLCPLQSLSLSSRKASCLRMGCPALALFVPHFEAGAFPRLVKVG